MTNKYLEKVSSITSTIGKGTGTYLRDNVAVPVATIFTADVGAHVVADKLSDKKKKDLVKKAKELSLMDKYKASSGFRDPKSQAVAGAVSGGLFASTLGYNAAKGVASTFGQASRDAFKKAKTPAERRAAASLKGVTGKIGKKAIPAAIILGAIGTKIGYHSSKDQAEERNNELVEKAKANPAFKQRLQESHAHPLTHPILRGAANSVLDAATGDMLSAPINFATSAFAQERSLRYNKDRIKALDKEAGVLQVAKSMTTNIKPTIGTQSTFAQANSLKSVKTALPKGTAQLPPPGQFHKAAGIKSYLSSVAKGTYSLGSSGAKSFGKALSGREPYEIVAKHRGVDLSNQGTLLHRLKNKGKVRTIYDMNDATMKRVVSSSPESSKALTDAINRRVASRAITGASALVLAAKMNQRKKQEPSNHVNYY